MGHNSDSDVMGTRVGGMLLTQVRSPPHWLTLKGAPNPKLGSPDAGRNLAKNAKNQKTSFLRPSKARPCQETLGCVCVILLLFNEFAKF